MVAALLGPAISVWLSVERILLVTAISICFCSRPEIEWLREIRLRVAEGGSSDSEFGEGIRLRLPADLLTSPSGDLALNLVYLFFTSLTGLISPAPVIAILSGVNSFITSGTNLRNTAINPK